MRKKREKNTRITKLVAETARKIFGSSKRLAIIFLLMEKEMGIWEIEEITGDSGSLILNDLVKLEKAWIIKREFQISKKDGVNERMLFKINEKIRSELNEIIDHFLEMQDEIERDKKEKEKEKEKI